MGALTEQERINKAVQYMEKIFPESVGQFELGSSQVWSGTPTAGAFSYFLPTQWTGIYKALTQNEGKVYFASEAASVTHGWIQGAMESALDACINISSKAASDRGCQPPSPWLVIDANLSAQMEKKASGSLPSADNGKSVKNA